MSNRNVEQLDNYFANNAFEDGGIDNSGKKAVMLFDLGKTRPKEMVHISTPHIAQDPWEALKIPDAKGSMARKVKEEFPNVEATMANPLFFQGNRRRSRLLFADPNYETVVKSNYLNPDNPNGAKHIGTLYQDSQSATELSPEYIKNKIDEYPKNMQSGGWNVFYNSKGDSQFRSGSISQDSLEESIKDSTSLNDYFKNGKTEKMSKQDKQKVFKDYMQSYDAAKYNRGTQNKAYVNSANSARDEINQNIKSMAKARDEFMVSKYSKGLSDINDFDAKVMFDDKYRNNYKIYAGVEDPPEDIPINKRYWGKGTHGISGGYKEPEDILNHYKHNATSESKQWGSHNIPLVSTYYADQAKNSKPYYAKIKDKDHFEKALSPYGKIEYLDKTENAANTSARPLVDLSKLSAKELKYYNQLKEKGKFIDE